MKKRDDKFTFETPEPLIDAARTICVEPGREYPYIAEFHLEADGTYRLFAMDTVSREISPHYGELIGRTGWDVDWIERDLQYCYHQSGGGGSLRRTISGIYWRHPAMLHVVREETSRYCDRAFRKRNRTRRLRRIPPEFLTVAYRGGDTYQDLMAFLENTGIDCDTYYCTVCGQRLPDRDEDYCEHVWWCDDDGILRGPGAEDDCKEPCDGEDCFYCSRQRESKK